ncbi:MAG: universal stress protein [Pirellulales bacterium]|nr:universal stress protein [Pirellulales bacterium]
MIKRLLVGLGGTRYTPVAVRYAVELARQFAASITGVTVLDLTRIEAVGSVPLGAGEAARELREHRLEVTRRSIEEDVVEFRRACGEAGLPFEVLQEVGDPFDTFIDLARYHDLMVFGLRGIFEYDVVPDPPDTLARLVQSGVRPLLAVSDVYRPIRRVLICYSGSMESAKTMKRFVQLGLWPEAELRIVTFDRPAGEAQELLAQAAAYCRAHGREPSTEYVPGSPKHQVLPYAQQWDADLLVVGNSARSLLLRRVLGETALEVMHNADRPLFLAQ